MNYDQSSVEAAEYYNQYFFRGLYGDDNFMYVGDNYYPYSTIFMEVNIHRTYDAINFNSKSKLNHDRVKHTVNAFIRLSTKKYVDIDDQYPVYVGFLTDLNKFFPYISENSIQSYTAKLSRMWEWNLLLVNKSFPTRYAVYNYCNRLINPYKFLEHNLTEHSSQLENVPVSVYTDSTTSAYTQYRDQRLQSNYYPCFRTNLMFFREHLRQIKGKSTIGRYILESTNKIAGEIFNPGRGNWIKTPDEDLYKDLNDFRFRTKIVTNDGEKLKTVIEVDEGKLRSNGYGTNNLINYEDELGNIITKKKIVHPVRICIDFKCEPNSLSAAVWMRSYNGDYIARNELYFPVDVMKSNFDPVSRVLKLYFEGTYYFNGRVTDEYDNRYRGTNQDFFVGSKTKPLVVYVPRSTIQTEGKMSFLFDENPAQCWWTRGPNDEKIYTHDYSYEYTESEKTEEINLKNIPNYRHNKGFGDIIYYACDAYGNLLPSRKNVIALSWGGYERLMKADLELIYEHELYLDKNNPKILYQSDTICENVVRVIQADGTYWFADNNKDRRFGYDKITLIKNVKGPFYVDPKSSKTMFEHLTTHVSDYYTDGPTVFQDTTCYLQNGEWYDAYQLWPLRTTTFRYYYQTLLDLFDEPAGTTNSPPGIFMIDNIWTLAMSYSGWNTSQITDDDNLETQIWKQDISIKVLKSLNLEMNTLYPTIGSILSLAALGISIMGSYPLYDNINTNNNGYFSEFVREGVGRLDCTSLSKNITTRDYEFLNTKIRNIESYLAREDPTYNSKLRYKTIQNVYPEADLKDLDRIRIFD